MTVNKMFQRVF